MDLSYPVLNEERRRAILDLVIRQGRVLITDSARQLKTSEVTIRKDLELLHEAVRCTALMVEPCRTAKAYWKTRRCATRLQKASIDVTMV